MKSFILIAFIFVVGSCGSPKQSGEPKAKESPMMYFKDTETNLCFGRIYQDPRTFVCVPCDSLKRVVIHDITEQ